MTDYVGIIDQSGETWGVRIPDLPGCYGAGDSAENAIRDAASAAREWIAHQEGSGRARPKARAMSEILAAGEVDVAAGEAAARRSRRSEPPRAPERLGTQQSAAD